MSHLQLIVKPRQVDADAGVTAAKAARDAETDYVKQVGMATWAEKLEAEDTDILNDIAKAKTY